MTKQRISFSRMGNNHSNSGVTSHNNGHSKENSHHNQQQQSSPFQINGYSSTRPFKFSEDEKVLCYEPDPTKAKVLYDSKVLEVVVTKDSRGRRVIEYLIHFQGWNSSWDRCVAEEFVLKDTEENRQLQNDLNEKANILKQGLKKGKRGRSVKNHRSNPTNNPAPEHIDDSSKSSWSVGESSDPDSSDDESGKKDEVQICIPDELKKKLEDDYFAIKNDKWVRLPTETPVVHILEDYVKYYAFTEIKATIERQKNKKQVNTSTVPVATSSACVSTAVATSANTVKSDGSKSGLVPEAPQQDELQRVFRRVSLLKEIVESVRVLFDFSVGNVLLYPEEEEQYALPPPSPYVPRSEATDLSWSFQIEDSLDSFEPPAKRLRGSSSADSNSESNSSSKRRSSNARPPINIETTDVKVMQYLDKLNEWQLIPFKLYFAVKCPSLVYGSIHLLRLFVKLPEILIKYTMPRRRMKIIVKHMNLFLEYLAKQNYLFGEEYFGSRQEVQAEMNEAL